MNLFTVEGRMNIVRSILPIVSPWLSMHPGYSWQHVFCVPDNRENRRALGLK